MDVPATLRAARGMRKVSQRQLAACAELPPSTLDRIEAGRTDPRVGTLAKLLAAIGLELAVCNGQGRVLRVDPEREKVVDWSGRHFPPHWEARPVDPYPFDGYWAYWRRDPKTRARNPTHTYWRRHPSVGFELWEDAT